MGVELITLQANNGTWTEASLSTADARAGTAGMAPAGAAGEPALPDEG
jgi:hypothetical protein